MPHLKWCMQMVRVSSSQLHATSRSLWIWRKVARHDFRQPRLRLDPQFHDHRTTDGIKYTIPNTFACNLAGLPRIGTDGTFTGSAMVKGYVDTAFSKDPTTHTVTVTEGAQVGIWWE